MLRILSNLHSVSTIRILNVLIVLRSYKSLVHKCVCVHMLTQTTVNVPSQAWSTRVCVHMLPQTTVNAPSQVVLRVFPSPQVPCKSGQANNACLHYALCILTFSLEPTQSLKRV